MEKKIYYDNGYFIGEVEFRYEQDGCQYYRRQGNGTMYYNNGMTMKGFWKDDKLNGYAEIKYDDGDEFKGQFVNGRKHGKGTYKYYKSGNVYDVVMNQNKCVMKKFNHKEEMIKEVKNESDFSM